MYHVLILLPFQEHHKNYIQQIGPDCSYTYATETTVTPEQVKDADIIFGKVPPKMLPYAGQLKWLHLSTAGADAYCKPGLLSADVRLTCSTGAYGLAVSEYLVTTSLMLCRKMDIYARQQAAHDWTMRGMVTSVWGSTTLVIGLGDIGGEYAARMKALGSHVIGVRRSPSTELPDYLDELYTVSELDTLLPRADFVAMVLPGTPQTYHIMNRERLALMKNTAYLINAGRGNSVDPDALYEALVKGEIAGAALDVTEPEPLPESSPLWDAPRCIITPHVAGKFFLQETFERMVRITGENFEKFLAGDYDNMRNIINRSTGYRTRQ